MTASILAVAPSLRRMFALVLLAALMPLMSACGYNTIPTAEERAKAAWSEVLNQYQRRADLIPNLVETVKGYAAHEKDTLDSVVEARSKATQTTLPADVLTDPEKFQQFQENQSGLTGALSRLIAITENYPDLKANQNFMQLQSEIADIENKLAASRRFFNNAVQ
jgi:LemA protein